MRDADTTRLLTSPLNLLLVVLVAAACLAGVALPNTGATGTAGPAAVPAAPHTPSIATAAASSGTIAFEENFEHAARGAGAKPYGISNASSSNVNVYTGAPTGTGAPASVTYTADQPTTVPGWVPATGSSTSACNGWVVNWNSSSPNSANGYNSSVDPNCGYNASGTWSDSWPYLRAVAEVLGQAQGQGTTNTNNALSAYTNNQSGKQNSGVQFATSGSPITVVPGHYYVGSAWYAATNCFAAHPLEQFNLTYGTTTVAVGGQIDPCALAANAGNVQSGTGVYRNVGTSGGLNNTTNITVTDPDYKDALGNPRSVSIDERAGTGGGIAVAKIVSGALQIPIGTSAVGLQLLNQQANGTGNDGGFDDPQLVDVTPTVDKSFSPALVAPGQTSTLTFTITNTTELDQKSDWGFTDVLPAGLTLANTTLGGSCDQSGNISGTNPVSTSGTSGGTIQVAGYDLAQGQASCTITATVTSATETTYTNSPNLTSASGNMTTLNGLLPGASATVQFAAPRVTVVKALGSARLSGGTHTNDQFTVALRTGSGTGTVVNDTTNSTTTGTGSTVTSGTGTTGTYVATAGTTYYPTETAAGTASLANYTATLTCTDATGRTTGLPTNVPYTATTGITPAAGANVTCTITNTAKPPTLQLSKILTGTGRVADTDQFTVAIRTGSATGTVVNDTTNSTTTGTGSTVTSGTGTTGTYTASAGTTYYLTETGAGTTNLANYTPTISCTDASGVMTALPTNAALGSGLAITPAAGARISCLLSNAPLPPSLNITKAFTGATIDPTTGAGTATYTVTVANSSATPTTFGALTDSPAFDPRLQVTGATWSGASSGSATGAGPYTLTGPGTAIGGNATKTYTVAVSYSYTGQSIPTGCTGAGTGLYNAVALPAGQENGTTADDSACGALTAVELQKVSAKDGAALAGSHWLLYTNTGGAMGAALTQIPVAPVAGRTGLFQIGGLAPGSYYLLEVTAPAGYELLAQPVGFTVNSAGAVSGVSNATTSTDSSTGLARLTASDVPALRLPFLGGSGLLPYTAAGLALLGLAAMLLLGARLRRRPRKAVNS